MKAAITQIDFHINKRNTNDNDLQNGEGKRKGKIKMKSYSKYFEDITESELLEGLLAYGLFSDKIPDFLTGEYFYNYCKTLTTRRRFEDKGNF